MIALLATMIGLGLVAGFATRGSLKNLTILHFRWTPVLFVSLVIALLPLFIDSLESSRRVWQLAAFAGVLLFLVVNLAATRGGVRGGFLVIALGWALNFIVIAANKGMPLSEWAYRQSGQTGDITAGSEGFYRIVNVKPGTLFRPLGDVIPVRAIHQVLSIGDCLLLLGASVVIAFGMHLRAPVEAKDSTTG